MKKIALIIPSVIAISGMLLLSTASLAAQKIYTLKVASFTPKKSATSRWFEKAKKDLAAKSGGKLVLEMFYGSSMGPMPRHYDLARKGVADMAFFQHGVTQGLPDQSLQPRSPLT